MLQTVLSATPLGVDAMLVRVEVDIAGGLPSFSTVGLAEAAVRESKVRVQAALVNSALDLPTGRITVNLAPAHVKKDGTAFDLPIALGLVAADGIFSAEALENILVLGELSLSGEVRPVRGVLACVEAARRAGIRRVLVPVENGTEAALVSGIEVICVRTFANAVEWFCTGDKSCVRPPPPAPPPINRLDLPNMADVRGQAMARRAVEIAAAGGHNMLLTGGPGAGKTMLARRLPTILPPMHEAEALEVTRIYSVAGLTLGGGLIQQRPFRAPHHTISQAGLVGGGTGIPRPGELSLAHRGVLFLDELPEFSRPVLETLREPLESGEVMISRASGSLLYPAQALVVAAMNPCPCGFYGHPRHACRCSDVELQRYRQRLSGPLLDRIDMHIDVPPVDLQSYARAEAGESSESIALRVVAARQKAHTRLQLPTDNTNDTKNIQNTTGVPVLNGNMSKAQLDTTAMPDDEGKTFLVRAAEKLGLSARSFDRILRVARTIADLDDDHPAHAPVRLPHIAEAMQYRTLDRVARH